MPKPYRVKRIGYLTVKDMSIRCEIPYATFQYHMRFRECPKPQALKGQRMFYRPEDIAACKAYWEAIRPE